MKIQFLSTITLNPTRGVGINVVSRLENNFPVLFFIEEY